MLVITCFSLVAFASPAVLGSVQRPHYTHCKGTDDTFSKIHDLEIINAEIGKTLTLYIRFTMEQTAGVNIVMKTSVKTPSGKPVQCIHMIIPRELKACGGNTELDQQLGADWNNECPIQAGEHTIRISLHLPNSDSVKKCIGDGNFIVTLDFEDQGKPLNCVSFPLSVGRG